MKNLVGLFLRKLFSSKLKILITFVLSIIFIVIFFPRGELRDFIIQKIPGWTNQNLYVDFSNWSFSFPPSTGLRLENLLAEVQKYPGVHVDELSVEPAAKTFFSPFPLGHINARGLFLGSLDFTSQTAAQRSENGYTMEQLDLDVEKMSVQELASFLQLGSTFGGSINLKADGAIEPTFRDQPDVTIDLAGQKLQSADTTVRTMMGPLQLPGIQLGQVTLRGKLSGGRFQIERLQISGDDVQGTIKGGMSMLLQPKPNGGVQPVPGAYTFEFDLQIKSNLEAKAGLFLSFLDAYKSPASGGSRYMFKISATSIEQPPAISTLR